MYFHNGNKFHNSFKIGPYQQWWHILQTLKFESYPTSLSDMNGKYEWSKRIRNDSNFLNMVVAAGA